MISNIKKPSFKISKNGEMLTYEYEEYKIKKHIQNNKFLLKSICELCKISVMTACRFIRSNKFQYILSAIDPEIIPKQFIYYIIYKNNIIKVGRTFDIKQRYSPDVVNNMLKKVSQVIDVDECENKLVDEFSKLFPNYNGSREYFIIEPEKQRKAYELFKFIVKQYKITEKEINKGFDKHIEYFRENSTYGTGFYVSREVAEIMINVYKKDNYNKIKEFFKMVIEPTNNIRKQDFFTAFKLRDKIKIKKNHKNELPEEYKNDEFFYWIYHGYTIIVNKTRCLINASRLWHTVCNIQNSKKRFDNFMKSKYITGNYILKDFAKTKRTIYPGFALLSGTYLPIYFANIILFKLDSYYAVDVSKILTEPAYKKASEKIDNNEYEIEDDEIINRYNLLKILLQANKESGKFIKNDEDKPTKEETKDKSTKKKRINKTKTDNLTMIKHKATKRSESI